MKLRNRLARSYSAVFMSLLGMPFVVIYLISRDNMRDEFHQHFKENTVSSFQLFIEVNEVSNDILEKLDKKLINNLRQNTLLYDSSQNLIYSGASNIAPEYTDQILHKLKQNNRELFLPYGEKELFGIKFSDRGRTYYGIAQAEDEVGKGTMKFLALILLASFSVSLVVVLLLSFYFSNLITRPIRRLTREIEDISPLDLSYRVYQDKGKAEVVFLASKFNEMLDKVENAFKFQHQYINHLSHELKTPLSVMMANVERSIVEDDIEKLRSSMQFQKNALMGLSNIMDIMLDISKMENMVASASEESIRIDEVIFECVEEIGILNNNVRFDFDIDSALTEANLTVACNSRMVKLALLNLIKNAFKYSSKEKPSIAISKSENRVQIRIANDGPLIDQNEQQKLFKQSFRGKNSLPGTGYGLGLVLTSRIVKMLNGTLEYTIVDGTKNCFTLGLPTAE